MYAQYIGPPFFRWDMHSLISLSIESRICTVISTECNEWRDPPGVNDVALMGLMKFAYANDAVALMMPRHKALVVALRRERCVPFPMGCLQSLPSLDIMVFRSLDRKVRRWRLWLPLYPRCPWQSNKMQSCQMACNGV